jgi:serine/threonine protein kinase
MAPECCTAGAFHGKLADVWAAGVSLYFMVHGKCPFISNNIMKLYEMIQNDPITYDESLPADLLDLLKHILERDPSKRYTVGQLHPHFHRNPPPVLLVKPIMHRLIAKLLQ